MAETTQGIDQVVRLVTICLCLIADFAKQSRFSVVGMSVMGISTGLVRTWMEAATEPTGRVRFLYGIVHNTEEPGGSIDVCANAKAYCGIIRFRQSHAAL